MLDLQEIVKILPHRYPFLMVDRILEMDPGKRIVGIKNVTINEPFFQGHFPGHPVMPGVLIIESMAQVAGILAYLSSSDEDRKKVTYFLCYRQCSFQETGSSRRCAPTGDGDNTESQGNLGFSWQGLCRGQTGGRR